MAAATAITAGVGLATSGVQLFQGAKQKREAEQALENYQRQEFSNVADNLSVYTRGTEMQLQESARLGSSGVDALSRSGARGVIGGMGRLRQAQQQQNIGITQNLEQQQQRIDQIRAQDEQRIRAMQEQREMQDISALSSQYQQGSNLISSGVAGLGQTGIGVAGMLAEEESQQDFLTSMYG